MKSLKLIALLLPVIGLSACGTTGETKNTGAKNEQIIVEDRNAQTSGELGGKIKSDNTDNGGGAETRVVVGEEQYQGGDMLDNPNSPLANRVVYFEYDSSNVREQDVITLEAHSAYLSDNPNVTIHLIGHTDERGSREYNLALGERRALAIRQILMLQGASVKQFQITSYGEERADVDGSDEAAWQQNRRVELNYIGR